MSRTFADARSWASKGSDLLHNATLGLTDTDVHAESTLPGWTVGQLIAHIAANADALSNLVHWAATGIETPMYPSVEARNAALEEARHKGATELLTWLNTSDAKLAAGFDALTDEQWAHPVTTIQGRTLPATELPWLRSREALVHAVDLDRSVSFTDLPAAFNEALIVDICSKRELAESDLPKDPRHQVAAWLAGRPHTLTGVADLGPWL